MTLRSIDRISPTASEWAAIEARQPAGFVLVPREPTEHMQIAGFESDAWDALGRAVLAKKGWPYSCRESAECVAGIFRAMLSAAPAAPECPTTLAAPESTCDAARVIEWAQSNPRPPASVAFTAGPERQAAYWIEWAQRQQGHQAQAAETEILAWLMHATGCDGSADWIEPGSDKPAAHPGFEAIPLGRIGVAKQSSSAPAPGGHCGFSSREAALESSLRIAVDSDLGRRWLYPDTARETWFDEARTALAQQAAQAPAEGDAVPWSKTVESAALLLNRSTDLPLDDCERLAGTILGMASKVQPKGMVEVPDGLSRSDAEFWLRHRSSIIDALQAEGMSIVSTAHGVRLMRLGKIEAQAATSTQAPAPAPGLLAGWRDAVQEALSVCDSVSMSRDRRVVREGCVLYLQTEEWCKWAEQEVAPKLRAALKTLEATSSTAPAVGAEPLKGQEMRRAFEADYRKRHDSRLCCESEWRGWQAGVAACISGAALSKPPVQGSQS